MFILERWRYNEHIGDGGMTLPKIFLASRASAARVCVTWLSRNYLRSKRTWHGVKIKRLHGSLGVSARLYATMIFSGKDWIIYAKAWAFCARAWAF